MDCRRGGSKRFQGELRYYCICDCGNKSLVRNAQLKNGISKSCGCARIFKQPPGQVSFTHIFKKYKDGANTRKILFELTKEQFLKIIVKDCNYCGEPPKLFNYYLKSGSRGLTAKKTTIERAWVKVNGVDREDNYKGYILDNCVPCCTICNLSKKENSSDAFIEHARKIVNYQDLSGKRKGIEDEK